ncbi:MAG: hypothetical protein ACAI44_00250 [Candidatus Sericytochromatia bacterium]
MQIKALSGFESQLKDLAQIRHQRAEDEYMAGMFALAQAKESSYSNKAALKEACSKLMGALQKNRSSPKPYLAMAYLLMITGDRGRAGRYIREALRLDPGNELAGDLLDSLNQVKHVTLDASDTLKRLHESPRQPVRDYDALYDQLEKAIRTALQQLMRQPHHTLPTVEPEELAALKAQLAELDGLTAGFHQQVRLLEAGLDTSALCQLMRPLEVLTRRYKQACALSETFAGMLAEIDASKHQTRILIHRFQIKHEDVSQAFEQRLDECDAIADKLDALDEKKVEIRPVKGPYKELLALVNVLQELLDENA